MEALEHIKNAEISGFPSHFYSPSVCAETINYVKTENTNSSIHPTIATVLSY